MNSSSSQFWLQGCFRLAAEEARKLINRQPLHVLLQTTTMQKSFPLCHWVMSDITTITLVATIAINIFIFGFTVFTTPAVALAVILFLCPTFVSWSLSLNIHLRPHFFHFTLCFWANNPNRVGMSRLL